MKSKEIYYWTCDKSPNSGEGNLAIYFIKNFNKNLKFREIKKKNFSYITLSKILNYKYILPFVGIFYCWKYYLNDKKICYINYLPFWNFLIFLLLPPNSNIGPITGGAKFHKKTNLIRRVLFPIFYKISEFIVNFRNFDLIFSTDLLKKYLSQKTIKKSLFNFIIYIFKNKKRNKKKLKKNLDFLIYYRNHPNKKKFFPFKLINKLLLEDFKIYVVGDKLNIKNVKNFGFVSNRKLLHLQKKAKFTIFSEENLYSIFTLECIFSNVLILVKKGNQNKIKYFKKDFLKIDFDNTNQLRKLKNIYKYKT